MIYGLEMMALWKRHEAELEEADMKKLRFLLRVTRID